MGGLHPGYQVTGGLLEWRGPGQWSPASVCVDWRSSNMAWVCQPVAVTPNLWSLQGDIQQAH